MTRRPAALAAACALLAPAACARWSDLIGAPAAGTAPAGAPPENAAPEQRLRPPSRPPNVYTPARPGSAVYSSPPLGPPGRSLRSKLTPYQLALIDKVSAAARAASAPVPIPDERFFDLAADLARLAPVRRQMPSEVLRFLSSHYGVVEPDPIVYTLRGPADETTTLKRFDQALPGMYRRPSAWNRLGVGVSRQGPDMVTVLAMWQQYIELEALPRQLRSGGRAHIAGRLLRAYGDPQVVVTMPSGDVRRLPLGVRNGAFETELRCAFGDGRYQAEMLATDAGGPLVLANFPLYCGVQAPGDVQAYEEEPDEIDPAEGEQELLALMNQDRRGAGLEPLIWDNRLAAIARAHSREMAERHYVAHVSPVTGDADARVRSAGLSFGLVSENVGQEGGVKQAHQGFMNSPGHRANVLNPRLTHVGVGIVTSGARGSGTPFFITELFAGQR